LPLARSASIYIHLLQVQLFDIDLIKKTDWHLFYLQPNMTFGACNLPEPSITPAPGTVANDSSFANFEKRPVQGRWLPGTVLVALFLSLSI
jgi:hypothetical protein